LNVLRSQAFRERKREYNMEYRIVRSGGVRWIESRCFISYDSDGRAQRLIGVNIDVTERKQTDARFADLNAQFDLAHRAARVGCYTYDISARTMRFSRASMASYGLSQSTMEITAQTMVRARASRRSAAPARRTHSCVQGTSFALSGPAERLGGLKGEALLSTTQAGRAERMTGVYIDVPIASAEALLARAKPAWRMRWPPAR
jgi:hypothetical protein